MNPIVYLMILTFASTLGFAMHRLGASNALCFFVSVPVYFLMVRKVMLNHQDQMTTTASPEATAEASK